MEQSKFLYSVTTRTIVFYMIKRYNIIRRYIYMWQAIFEIALYLIDLIGRKMNPLNLIPKYMINLINIHDMWYKPTNL